MVDDASVFAECVRKVQLLLKVKYNREEHNSFISYSEWDLKNCISLNW